MALVGRREGLIISRLVAAVSFVFVDREWFGSVLSLRSWEGKGFFWFGLGEGLGVRVDVDGLF